MRKGHPYLRLTAEAKSYSGVPMALCARVELERTTVRSFSADVGDDVQKLVFELHNNQCFDDPMDLRSLQLKIEYVEVP